ncbi:hypothetical protein BC830DRAFT_751476 [Chytriomyces sp. MP71]|nr:hypothetical protein BC830DRAFT_751476 [Chytriomyces sp. MP71]
MLGMTSDEVFVDAVSSAVESFDAVSVKLTLHGVTRRFQLEPSQGVQDQDALYSSLVATTRSLYGLVEVASLHFLWTDHDGDAVTVSSGIELTECIRAARCDDGLVKLRVCLFVMRGGLFECVASAMEGKENDEEEVSIFRDTRFSSVRTASVQTLAEATLTEVCSVATLTESVRLLSYSKDNFVDIGVDTNVDRSEVGVNTARTRVCNIGTGTVQDAHTVSIGVNTDTGSTDNLEKNDIKHARVDSGINTESTKMCNAASTTAYDIWTVPSGTNLRNSDEIDFVII